MKIRLLSILCVLCVLCGCVFYPAFSESVDDDEDLNIDEVIEDVIVDDDGKEYVIDEETGEAILLDESDIQQLEALDETIDDTVDPDSLEINPNLPDNVVNILLIGVDTRKRDMGKEVERGDVQIILSLNKETGAVKLSSILRDTYVTIPGYKNKQKINVAYARGGGNLAMRTINHNFDMNIRHYVAINFYGLASIIDSIGGIDVDLTKAEAGAINAYLRKHPPAYDNKEKGSRVALEKVAGVQHLDGVQAVMYARLRSLDNDFARTGRQRHLLDLLLKAVMQDMTPDKAFELINACIPYAKTNINAVDMFSLASEFLQSGILEKAKTADTLIEQFRIPMDKSYSYQTVNGSSVINLSTAQLKKNKEALHQFIYGSYYSPNAG